MLRPEELTLDVPLAHGAPTGVEVWEAVSAANNGDAAQLARLITRTPALARGEFYTAPLHFASRQGHRAAVEVLLACGQNADELGLNEDLILLTKDRGHVEIAGLLEGFRDVSGRVRPSDETDPAIHEAAAEGDLAQVNALLDADPSLLESSDAAGGTPLHRAVAASSHEVVRFLLDHGADINARHGGGRASHRGYPAVDFEPIDFALWQGPFWGARDELSLAQYLIQRGAAYDIVIATALGDREYIEDVLEVDRTLADVARPCGKRALSTAVEYHYGEIVKLLLEKGADPNLAEGSAAPHGVALFTASRLGEKKLVEMLLAHGADPNSHLDSSGSATYAANTKEIRAVLIAAGGKLDPYDLVWLGEDDEVVRRVVEDPRSADSGCGGVFTAAATNRKRDLVVRLLSAGARVPPIVTACRSYLWEDPEILKLLLASGMDPDLPNWHRATPLHDLCTRDRHGEPRERRHECAKIFLNAGANISARDDDYLSTPLAWAARHDVYDMVEFLLDRGAPTNVAGDEEWATPLSWARRRGHHKIVERLERAGAFR
jgi:ankyrin repeat protein